MLLFAYNIEIEIYRGLVRPHNEHPATVQILID